MYKSRNRTQLISTFLYLTTHTIKCTPGLSSTSLCLHKVRKKVLSPVVCSPPPPRSTLTEEAKGPGPGEESCEQHEQRDADHQGRRQRAAAPRGVGNLSWRRAVLAGYKRGAITVQKSPTLSYLCSNSLCSLHLRRNVCGAHLDFRGQSLVWQQQIFSASNAADKNHSENRLVESRKTY